MDVCWDGRVVGSGRGGRGIAPTCHQITVFNSNTNDDSRDFGPSAHSFQVTTPHTTTTINTSPIHPNNLPVEFAHSSFIIIASSLANEYQRQD